MPPRTYDDYAGRGQGDEQAMRSVERSGIVLSGSDGSVVFRLKLMEWMELDGSEQDKFMELFTRQAKKARTFTNVLVIHSE
jgi:hypothetical protein